LIADKSKRRFIVQVPKESLCFALPWFRFRRIKESQMLDVDIFHFFWLGLLVEPIARIPVEAPLSYFFADLVTLNLGLEGFQEGTILAEALPSTASSARELLDAVNEIIPPVGSPVPNINRPVETYKIQRIKTLATGLTAMLKDEAQRSYILKVEDQRCFSNFSLMDKIEKCFSKECWDTITDEAKREFGECGKCLALERYTGSGFHALRGVECVIKQFIEKLTGQPPPKDKKRDWGYYIDVLKSNGADPKLISVLDNIRSLERNPLMHPDDWLEVDEAVAIFTLSNTAIVRLVAGITKP
jgi:hypothetical protein